MTLTRPCDLHFRTREAWSAWLRDHHAAAREAWVILHKKASRSEGLRYGAAEEEALCYGWIDSTMNRVNEVTYRQRFSPRRPNSGWSPSNRALATRPIAEGRMTQAGFDAINEGKRRGRWHDA